MAVQQAEVGGLGLDSPGEDAQDQVQHEEGAHHDQRDEEDPVVRAPDGVVRLRARGQNRYCNTWDLVYMFKY